MYAQQLGFMSSWKMMTRDKGWIKPLLMLTLVGWIPILGQIAILGFGLEWARLTAWGVDAAPKQHGVAYGKVLSTGGIAFLVMVSMSIVLGIVDMFLFGGWYPLAAYPMGIGAFSTSLFDFAAGTSMLLALVLFVVNLLMGTFTTAAMMRATLYDSFGAGWRIDRLFQMIGRDAGGFMHAYAVSLIGSAISAAYSMVVALVGGLLAFGGIVGVMFGTDMRGGDFLNHLVYNMGPGIVVLAVVAVVAAMFIGGVISTAMQLVTINAMGQWFCRFEVGRWGISSDPLPEGVPSGTSRRAGGGTPVQPDPSAGVSAAAQPQQPGGGWAAPAQPQQPGATQAPFTGQASGAADAPGYRQAPSAPASSPVAAASAPADPSVPDGSAPATAVLPVSDGAASDRSVEEGQDERAPIALGPVEDDGAAGDEDAQTPVTSSDDEGESPIQSHD